MSRPETPHLLHWIFPALSLVVVLYSIYDAARRGTQPNPPSAVLTCITAGLPDLAIVCDIQASPASTHGWYINFGDGGPAIRSKRSDTTPSDPDVSEQDSTSPEPERLHHAYEEPGSYRVNLVVIGKGGQANVWQDLTVSHSNKLERRITASNLVITAFEEIGTEGQESRLPHETLFSRRLSRHNFIGDARQSYSIPFEPDTGWLFRETDCEFESLDEQFAYNGKFNFDKGSRKGYFRFDLESSSFFRGSEDGWLYGKIKCDQYRDAAVETVSLMGILDHLDRYGIHEVNLGESNNPIPASPISLDRVDWKVELDGRRYSKKGTESILHRGFRIRLEDVPFIPLEIRLNKAYLRVEPAT